MNISGIKHKKTKIAAKYHSFLKLYIEQENKMNEMLSYTMIYCHNRCHMKPVGCCSSDWSEHGLKNRHILKLFRKLRGTAKKTGKEPCPWHSTKKGCMLKMLKTPVCIGMFCPSIISFLKDNFAIKYDRAEFTGYFENILKGNINKNKIDHFNRVIDKMVNAFEKKKSVFTRL